MHPPLGSLKGRQDDSNYGKNEDNDESLPDGGL